MLWTINSHLLQLSLPIVLWTMNSHLLQLALPIVLWTMNSHLLPLALPIVLLTINSHLLPLALSIPCIDIPANHHTFALTDTVNLFKLCFEPFSWSLCSKKHWNYASVQFKPGWERERERERERDTLCRQCACELDADDGMSQTYPWHAADVKMVQLWRSKKKLRQ